MARNRNKWPWQLLHPSSLLNKELFPAPEIEVVDDRHRAVSEKFYKLGSTIELMCTVRRIVGREPEYVLWHHEHKMLNYDAERGGIRYDREEEDENQSAEINFS